jgi:hypothetical protein
MPMFALWTNNIPFLLFANSGGIILIPFVATVLVLRKRQFCALALVLAIAAGLLNVAVELGHRSSPSNNILYRDIFTTAVLAFACPLAMAAAAAVFAHRSVLARIAAAATVVAAFVFATPFLVLIAHCTSGDCL